MLRRWLSVLKYSSRWRWLWQLTAAPLGFVFFIAILLRLRSSKILYAQTTPEASGPAIFVNWHQCIPALVHEHGHYRRTMLMSQAPYMASIGVWCRLAGMRLIRGGSGENGRAAFDQMEACLKAGQSVVIAVDGPAGPARRMKRGCLELARRSGAPLYAVGYRCARGHESRRRWDRSLLPGFFDTLTICYSKPLRIDELSDDDQAIALVTAELDAVSPP